jgi:hypothetical protein
MEAQLASIQLRTITTLQGQSVFIGRLLGHVDELRLTKDVFVNGPKFEQAVTMFARRILNLMILVERRCATAFDIGTLVIWFFRSPHLFLAVVIEGESSWDQKKVQANRNGFSRAIKKAAVAHKRVRVVLLFTMQWDKRNGEHFCRIETALNLLRNRLVLDARRAESP